MKPESIENRWDILYRDHPEVYDEFASFPYSPRPVDVVSERSDLGGKTVADLGAGSGRSTLVLAERAALVIGVEPEDAMRAVAEEAARRAGMVGRVRFLQGDRERIPLGDRSVDAVTSFTAGLDVAEALRVVRPGGVVISLDIAPAWYGGDLRTVIGEDDAGLERFSAHLVGQGFSFFDFDSVQEYGSVENIVRTYGFIFGRRAIAHLRETRRTSIRWRFRVHYRTA